MNEKRHRGWRWLGAVVLFVAVIGSIARVFLPSIVRDYVTRTLDRSLTYEGRIGEAEIHLLRGAYSIHDVRISQRIASVPGPFFEAKQVDFSIQWNALLHGRIVGQFVMREPELNFVAPAGDNEGQTGAGGPWLQMIQDLCPFAINSVVIADGSVHFRAYQSRMPADVYLSHLDGSIDDLSNILNETKPLVTTVQATAMAMDQAKLEFKMALDPFSYRPTFHMALRLLGLDVTKLNDLALAYGKFDFKRGWLDLVLEADSKEGQLTGYVKPLFRNLRVFSLGQDLKEDTVPQFFWQALVGATTAVFKNIPRDQFGTLIPFTGDASGTTTADIPATVANLLRNAFVRAYLPQLQPGSSTAVEFHFEAPGFVEYLATTATEAQ